MTGSRIGEELRTAPPGRIIITIEADSLTAQQEEQIARALKDQNYTTAYPITRRDNIPEHLRAP